MGEDGVMYYALTIRDDVITGVHSSTAPFKKDHFGLNPKFANDKIVLFESGEYKSGHNIREYDGGKLLPLVDRIKAGFANIPIGYELIDEELVKSNVPVEEQSPGIRQRLEESDARIAALEEEIARMKLSVSVLSQDLATSEPTARKVV